MVGLLLRTTENGTVWRKMEEDTGKSNASHGTD